MLNCSLTIRNSVAHRFIVSTAIVVSAIGCGSESVPNVPKAQPVETQPVAMQPVASKKEEPSKEDLKINAIKAKVATYLDEARAGAKLLTLKPSPEQITEKSKHMTDLFTHLPDLPAKMDPTGQIAVNLKLIRDAFNLADKFSQLGGGSSPIRDPKNFAEDVRRFADEIETALGL